MDLEAKVWGGYLIRCNRGHCFIVENPRDSIECPNCGQVESTSDLGVAPALRRNCSEDVAALVVSEPAAQTYKQSARGEPAASLEQASRVTAFRSDPIKL